VYQMKVAARVGDTHGEEEPSLPLPMPGPPSLYHTSLCAGARFARCGSKSTGKETPRGRGRGLQQGALNVQRENLSGLEGHAADKNSAAPGRPRATSPSKAPCSPKTRRTGTWSTWAGAVQGDCCMALRNFPSWPDERA